MVSVLGVATVFHLRDTGWSAAVNRICFAGLLILQFPVTSLEFWNFSDRFPIALALRMETRDDFLKRSLRSYAGAQHLNALAKANEPVLAVGVEDVRLYTNARLETLEDSTVGSVSRTASSMHGEALLRMLRQSGFAYIFVKRDALKNPPVWHSYIQEEFLKNFSTVAFSDANTVIYRLSD